VEGFEVDYQMTGAKAVTRPVLLVLSAILFATSAFAVDGQVLINQSREMAAGGFPYRITQPGSYKLTGNLTMTTTVNGNINSTDVAIEIDSGQVTLELRGHHQLRARSSSPCRMNRAGCE